jgi:hypothetical protein
METLIAFLLISTPAQASVPNYKVNTCHAASTDSRPNTIKIMSIETALYTYKVWNPDGWSDTFAHSFEAIEEVYSNARKCPDDNR